MIQYDTRGYFIIVLAVKYSECRILVITSICWKYHSFLRCDGTRIAGTFIIEDYILLMNTIECEKMVLLTSPLLILFCSLIHVKKFSSFFFSSQMKNGVAWIISKRQQKSFSGDAMCKLQLTSCNWPRNYLMTVIFCWIYF